MNRGIPWRWLRPGPERDEARARQQRRGERREEAARSRERSERRADRDSEVRRLWGLGWPGRDIAGRFGISKARVSEIVAGMPRRRRYGDPGDVACPFPRRLAEALEALARRHRVEPSGERLPGLDARRSGSTNGRAKLVEADVARMKELKAAGWTYPALAREFHVSRSNVYYILSGSTWSHVPAGPAATGGTP